MWRARREREKRQKSQDQENPLKVLSPQGRFAALNRNQTQKTRFSGGVPADIAFLSGFGACKSLGSSELVALRSFVSCDLLWFCVLTRISMNRSYEMWDKG